MPVYVNCIVDSKLLMLQPIDSCLLMYSVQPGGRGLAQRLLRLESCFSMWLRLSTLSLQLSLLLALLLPFLCLKNSIWAIWWRSLSSKTRKLCAQDRIYLCCWISARQCVVPGRQCKGLEKSVKEIRTWKSGQEPRHQSSRPRLQVCMGR